MNGLRRHDREKQVCCFIFVVCFFFFIERKNCFMFFIQFFLSFLRLIVRILDWFIFIQHNFFHTTTHTKKKLNHPNQFSQIKNKTLTKNKNTPNKYKKCCVCASSPFPKKENKKTTTQKKNEEKTFQCIHLPDVIVPRATM